ncbi:MAG: hypothetical protein QM692_21740 [Thermomicrobiales bacterium]
MPAALPDRDVVPLLETGPHSLRHRNPASALHPGLTNHDVPPTLDVDFPPGGS